MAKFYFTYGTSRQYPYQGGWTEVIAPNGKAAIAAFRAIHPDEIKGVLNCSDMYPERAFRATRMYTEGNFGVRCHEKITLLRECSTDLKGEEHD